MLILPALASLFTYLFWRPHQIFSALQGLSINTLIGLALVAYVLDLKTGWTRPRGSPLVVLLTCLWAWCILTVVVKAPENLGIELAKLTTSFLMLIFVSEGLQSFRAIKAMALLLMVFTLGFGTLGVDQGLTPSVCYRRADDAVTESAEAAVGFDGRPCATRLQCNEEAGVAGGEFGCEHPGWLGTSSIEGRVRYLGILEDPNELAWVLTMGLPFCFAFYEERPSGKRLALLIAGLVITATCVIMTKSRSGQLSLMGALGVYFIRRYRGRGAIAALIAGLPILLLGGRSGEEADSSSTERLGCWSEALSMWRENPIFGVGSGQFTEHNSLTAHNSFLLTLAELGPIGFLLWTASIYFAFKITIRIQVDLGADEQAAVARSWATALLASLTGLVISAFFLSIAYHPALWIFLGLTGALYGAVRKHAPSFRVPLTSRDVGLVAGVDVALIIALYVYLRLKGA
ncbi:MAG TPA: O-antigen ligase family protein [Polyangia bacterium]|nr:O-antigen ligase family protein [Polyangia bacterium]